MENPRGRILIADDEEGARRGLGQILTEDGYEVLLAANGEEALRVVGEESPDVLLTDLRMPGMDGHELLQRLRKAHPDVAIVIMTAYGTGSLSCAFCVCRRSQGAVCRIKSQMD